jgi:hypothetical protein
VPGLSPWEGAEPGTVVSGRYSHTVRPLLRSIADQLSRIRPGGVLDVLGLALIIAGIAMLAAPGWAVIAAGIALLLLSSYSVDRTGQP